MRRLVPALAALISIACRPEETRSADSVATRGTTIPAERAESLPSSIEARPSVRLVDSLHYSNEMEEGVLQYLELRRGGRVDTLRQIRTDLPAVIAGDSLIYGFLYDSLGEMTHVFRYRLATEQLDSLPLLPGLQPGVSNPAFAPDGQHVAYVVFDSSARGVVRRYPDLAIVLETPRVQHLVGDMLGGAAGWRDARTFEIYIAPNDTSARWIRFRGQLGSERLDMDSLRADPEP